MKRSSSPISLGANLALGARRTVRQCRALRLRDICPIECLGAALLYVVLARASQVFAIEPGNITPVWLPSGVLLALALKLGLRLWPGVFIGAFVGNIWAYIEWNGLSQILLAGGAALVNGIGDSIAICLMALLITNVCKTSYPLTRLSHYYYYLIFGVGLGSVISATFGIAGLFLFGFLDEQALISAFFTWLIGDGVGVLIIGPFMLAWLNPSSVQHPHYAAVFVTMLALALLLSSAAFGLLSLSREYWLVLILLCPAYLMMMVSYGQRLVFTIQVSISFIALLSTLYGKGPFAGPALNESLIHLQTFMAAFSAVLIVVALVTEERRSAASDISKRREELEQLYRKDALTGLWNRYRIKEFLQQVLQRYRRNKREFGLLLLDIDNFKRINDDFGHTSGDSVLEDFARVLSLSVRENDFIARWGGEEFLMIVEDTSQERLEALGNKIRLLIEGNEFSIGRAVTVSVGATLVKENDIELTLIERADEAMYQAKKNGKNCVVMI